MKDTDRIIKIGNIFYGEYKGGFAGNIISPGGICFALTCDGGGDRQPMIVEYMEQDKFILQKKGYGGGKNTRLFKDYSPTMCCNYFSDCVPYVIEIINE